MHLRKCPKCREVINPQSICCPRCGVFPTQYRIKRLLLWCSIAAIVAWRFHDHLHLHHCFQ